MNSKIKALNKRLEKTQVNASGIEIELQAAYNEVFQDITAIRDAVSALESSNEYAFDKHGEICQYSRWYGLKDFAECKEYFTEYMRETHCVDIDWDNDCLTMSQGDSITIQDDTRYDNGVWEGRKLIIKESEYRDEETNEVDEAKRNALIEAHMEKTGYFPGVFRTDSGGNVFPVNTQKNGTQVNKLFTLIKYSMNGQMTYSLYLTTEAKIKLANLLRDSRASEIGIVGLFDSLVEAQAKQTELRKA